MENKYFETDAERCLLNGIKKALAQITTCEESLKLNLSKVAHDYERMETILYSTYQKYCRIKENEK